MAWAGQPLCAELVGNTLVPICPVISLQLTLEGGKDLWIKLANGSMFCAQAVEYVFLTAARNTAGLDPTNTTLTEFVPFVSTPIYLHAAAKSSCGPIPN
jgi:hypothetical protein